jgi:hypothetical protein
MKQLKNYLPLYFGCDVQRKERSKSRKLTPSLLSGLLEDETGNCYGYRPVLRPLADMTKTEAIDVAGLSEWEGHFNDVKAERNMFDDIVVSWQGACESREVFNATGEVFYCSEQFIWLLANRFDLFGLIEDGLAIDKTKQQKQIG